MTIQNSASSAPLARAIAFYLPQFHPIAENNAWWGKGFTEWANVVGGRPRFPGHHQPHLPADLGFYDLRVPETRQEQADLARAAGIEAFCYYHYWFQGKRLLGAPIDAVLASGKPDFPFCFCWANQKWSRTWSGRGHDVLIDQGYDEAESRDHIEWLIKAFRDPRYVIVEGRPLFLIYLPESLPEPHLFLSNWRSACNVQGVADPYFCAVRTGFSSSTPDKLLALGFDGVVEFEPNYHNFPRARNATGRVVSLTRQLLPEACYDALRNNRWLGSERMNTIVDYSAYVDQRVTSPPLGSTTYPSVFPSWDNSARKTSATIIENHDPGCFKRWLDDAVARVSVRKPEHRLVFINAWNEWAEGCHLEPDTQHGHVFLEATAAALGLRR